MRMTDLMIEYSKLVFSGDGGAEAHLETGSQTNISALLSQVVERKASELAADEAVALVTTSIDITGSAAAAPTQFITRVDRRTRTLIFLGGEATQDGKPVLRMTSIYRIG